VASNTFHSNTYISTDMLNFLQNFPINIIICHAILVTMHCLYYLGFKDYPSKITATTV